MLWDLAICMSCLSYQNCNAFMSLDGQGPESKQIVSNCFLLVFLDYPIKNIQISQNDYKIDFG